MVWICCSIAKTVNCSLLDESVVTENNQKRLSVIGGLDYWTGIPEWTTGTTFDHNFNIIIIVSCCDNQQ